LREWPITPFDGETYRIDEIGESEAAEVLDRFQHGAKVPEVKKFSNFRMNADLAFD